MPELKPCPACGEAKSIVFIQDEFNNEWRGHCRCGHVGRYCATREAAIAAWNSLPRRPDYNDVDCADCPERRRGYLTWTHEPPKVAGIFLAESTLDNCSKKITPIEVFSSDHWRHSDWEKRHGKLSCLLCLGGFGVCPVSKYSRFAGPIPTPLEPEES